AEPLLLQPRLQPNELAQQQVRELEPRPRLPAARAPREHERRRARGRARRIEAQRLRDEGERRVRLDRGERARRALLAAHLRRWLRLVREERRGAFGEADVNVLVGRDPRDTERLRLRVVLLFLFVLLLRLLFLAISVLREDRDVRFAEAGRVRFVEGH